MGQRRMFSNRIANSARFLQMPAESQLLYFHMILRADDDGVVESYPLMKLLGLAPDNFKVLLAKSFIRQLNEDQVVVIMDWLEHNVIRADRKIDSIYKHLFPLDVKTIEPKARSDVEDNSKRLGGQSTDGISQVKLSKDNKNSGAKAPQQKPFNVLEIQERWKNGERDDFRILAWFFSKKKIWEKLKNEEQLKIAVGRHIKAARIIVKGLWKLSDVKPIFEKLNNEDKFRNEWTLETIIKYLTK